MSTSSIHSFEKISPTALLVTHARQFSDIPYAAEIAEWADAQTVVENFVPGQESTPLHTTILIEARYKMINRVLRQFGAAQILELASGLLPRGIIVTQNPSVTYVESDLPEMLAQKRSLIKELIGDRPNLHFEVIDATQRPNSFPIGADYLDDDKPIAILCEGLLGYLTFAEKERLFANVRETLQHYGGVWITSDFVTKERRQPLLEAIPAMRQLNESISANTGRSLNDNSFDTIEHVKQFTAEQGFQATEHSFLEIFDDLCCINRLEIDPDFVKRILAASSVFALTLRN
jgi:O-methyltransferase involved in polyketide biosynthesis